MTIKILGAIAVVSAVLSNPVFAQSARVHRSVHELRHFRGAYNQVHANDRWYSAPAYGWDAESFGRDRSWVGGEDPSLRPSGN
jgi:hypothetical protein